jgi:DNA mismatch repair protein MutS
MAGSFVPNSIELGADKRLLLLTGPNMAGKSTLMRQTGLCLLLAQCGLPVSATAMQLAPCSGFFSRMGASDKIFEGESTFMVEMKETASLLREADSNSFVLIDEIGRGTSTEDGLAIAQAVLEYLHDETACVAVFATHYHELSSIAAELPHALNGSMGIKEWKGELVFLRTLKLEAAESSYGIYVAKMAGLPKKLLKRAQDVFIEALESGSRRHGAGPQLDFFASPSAITAITKEESEADVAYDSNVARDTRDPLTEELAKLDLNDISPRQAWLILESLANAYAPSRLDRISTPMSSSGEDL